MAEPLKNMFNQTFFAALTRAFSSVYPRFDQGAFLANIYDDQWDARELKARTRHITTVLGKMLPQDYRTALEIVRAAAPLMNGFGYETMIFPDFVECYGLDDWEVSLAALEQFTQQSSAEFAVRPFILRDQKRMMAQMLGWAGHTSHHVRRLASEGCRPRLPWAIALPAFKKDPSPILPVLERLRHDDSEYVRRSVANNLNDISKDHPQLVVEILRGWSSDSADMRRLVSHALRTLIKQGNAQALALAGYGSGTGETAVTIKNLTVWPNSIPLGGEITFGFDVIWSGDSPQNMMIDYIIHLVRAGGKRSPKVFKLAKRTLHPGETLTITRKHSFRPVTTRRYYPGEHAVEIQINGVSCGRAAFLITS